MQDNTLQDFLARSWEVLAQIDEQLASLADDPTNIDLVALISDTIRTLNKSSQSFRLRGLCAISDEAATVLDSMCHGPLPVTAEAVSLLREAVDEMKELVGGHEATGSEPPISNTELMGRLCRLSSSNVCKAAATADQPATQFRSALVVDTSMFFRHLMAAALEDEGYTVTAVGSATEAVALCGRTSPPFDLIVSDIELPTMSGLEFAGWLRNCSNIERTPLIAMTGLAGPEHESRALQAGFDCFLTKFNAKELSRAITRIEVARFVDCTQIPLADSGRNT